MIAARRDHFRREPYPRQRAAGAREFRALPAGHVRACPADRISGN
jgi:hypothetical protein